ncbi:presenilins-associated rhomboid-like protein, mitochondrial [Bacillus rossius redtenbacheri]|uniref:presenilins-associated rhomboid-like protein, mitochondrial n=1 Tax=Bacillus rossius redtenbacheri TaxID=93214 RepID=UPI002FDECE4F
MWSARLIFPARNFLSGQPLSARSGLLNSRVPIQCSNIRTGGSRKAPRYGKGSNFQPKTETKIEVETGPVSPSKLWKPLGFTVAFSSACFVGASIWQYENILARRKQQWNWYEEQLVRPRKYGWIRDRLNHVWNGLTEGQKTFYVICFANVLVFLCWRIPMFQSTMVRYFCSNPASRVVCWPMALSMFSHYAPLHLFCNMYVLHSFSSGACASLGKEQFVALYLAGGMVASMASYVYKCVAAKPGLSLGASGAIMTILAYVCSRYPDLKLSIVFMPFFTFSAGTAIKVIMGLDAVGILLGWKLFDHAAHLGGAACGLGYYYWGDKYVWQKREVILRWWHNIRGSGSH